MRFEEALAQLRDGKAITHEALGDDVYYIGCYVSINPLFNPVGEESFEEIKARGMSICMMKGTLQHPDMCPKFDLDNPPKPPSLNIFLMMDDEWKIYERPKPQDLKEGGKTEFSLPPDETLKNIQSSETGVKVLKLHGIN